MNETGEKMFLQEMGILFSKISVSLSVKWHLNAVIPLKWRFLKFGDPHTYLSIELNALNPSPIEMFI